MNNIIQLVWLVPVLPLVGFLINGLFRKSLPKSITSIVGCGVLLASFVVSVLIYLQVKDQQIVKLFDFIAVGDLSIPFAFQVDPLSSLFLLIITGIGFLIHLYST